MKLKNGLRKTKLQDQRKIPAIIKKAIPFRERLNNLDKFRL